MTGGQRSLFERGGYSGSERPVRLPAAQADPTTSWAQAERLVASGRLHAGIAAVVAALRPYDGSTSRELSAAAGLDRHEAARRLADARRLGLVAQGAPRADRATGTRSVTWWLTEAGRGADVSR